VPRQGIISYAEKSEVQGDWTGFDSGILGVLEIEERWADGDRKSGINSGTGNDE
jgi:hypothetical protein